MFSIPQDSKSSIAVEGDRYILCRFNLHYGTIVEDSSNFLEEMLRSIPNFFCGDDSEDLYVCEVYEWCQSSRDPSDSNPSKMKTLFKIEHLNDPSE